jgi:cytochrome c oxidase subunit 2
MKTRSIFLYLLLSLALALPAAWGADDLFAQGKKVFEGNCVECHRVNGKGLPGTYPALDGNSFVIGKPQPVIATVLKGRKGHMGQMPTWKDKLGDDEVAVVVTYIRHAWSNKAPGVTPAQVAEVRKKAK